jgi:hypothetical protein
MEGRRLAGVRFVRHLRIIAPAGSKLHERSAEPAGLGPLGLWTAMKCMVRVLPVRRTLALLSALLLAGGCSDDGEQPPPAATVPSQVTTSSTAPPAPDPAVIPEDLAEIDEAYVQAVVDELFAVEAKAAQIFIATRDPLDERALEYLRAIYVQEEFETQVNIWFQSLALRADKLTPGTLVHDVDRVIDARPDCVYIQATRDYSDTTVLEVAPEIIYLGLTPKRGSTDFERLNPTAWMLFMNGLNADGSQPENPCAGR